MTTTMKTGKRKTSASQRRKKPADLPRRSLSAYNLFFRDERGKVMEDNRRNGVSSSSTFGALGRAVAERWKKLTPEELERYHEMAAEDKKRYKREMDAYKANALGVHKERIEQRRLAGELPMTADGITFYAESEPSTASVSGSSLLQSRQEGCLHMLGHAAAPTPSHSLDSMSLLNLRDQLALSNRIGGLQDPSQALLSQLLEARLSGHAQLPLSFGATPSSLSYRVPPTSILDQQLAMAALEAEHGRQMEQQATQHLLQNAIANQQLQLAMAQQASLSTSVARPTNYLANILGHGQQQLFGNNASAQDLLLASLSRDQNLSSSTSAVPSQVNPQLSLWLQQARQSRENAAKGGAAGSPPQF